ncbi:hypothetical protein E2562_027470 [Oryza meyeriana var. granulata]|uniref:Uncharacterized protein n=1 Tax=Oryza meyeriana var. granulata TaxID=110450 RepID=A0A6G1CK64_9ORYZ|nr:hypothetical protein E2562_027470 [Oryza meyeriana var. granulata]
MGGKWEECPICLDGSGDRQGVLSGFFPRPNNGGVEWSGIQACMDLPRKHVFLIGIKVDRKSKHNMVGTSIDIHNLFQGIIIIYNNNYHFKKTCPSMTS